MDLCTLPRTSKAKAPGKPITKKAKYMLKYLGVLIVFLFSTPSYARTVQFYKASVDRDWVVFGREEPGVGALCYAVFDFPGDSNIFITRDLKSGELYLTLKNNRWNIDANAFKAPQLTVIMKGRNNQIIYKADLKLKIQTKNMLYIPWLNKTSFLKSLGSARQIYFELSGKIDNIEAPAASKAVGYLSLCETKWSMLTGAKVKTPNEIPTVGGDDKIDKFDSSPLISSH